MIELSEIVQKSFDLKTDGHKMSGIFKLDEL